MKLIFTCIDISKFVQRNSNKTLTKTYLVQTEAAFRIKKGIIIKGIILGIRISSDRFYIHKSFNTKCFIQQRVIIINYLFITSYQRSTIFSKPLG